MEIVSTRPRPDLVCLAIGCPTFDKTRETSPIRTTQSITYEGFTDTMCENIRELKRRIDEAGVQSQYPTYSALAENVALCEMGARGNGHYEGLPLIDYNGNPEIPAIPNWLQNIIPSAPQGKNLTLLLLLVIGSIAFLIVRK